MHTKRASKSMLRIRRFQINHAGKFCVMLCRYPCACYVLVSRWNYAEEILWELITNPAIALLTCVPQNGLELINSCNLDVDTSLMTLRRLGRFSYATITFAVSPLFLSLAITAFGGSEG